MNVRALVVDDNPTNLKLACDILALEGFTVLRATEAEGAQAILRMSMVDVILMDLELPGTDGLTLTRLLKGDPATRHIPVVALTAFAMKGDDERALAAGCSGYIAKPIDTRRFASQVISFIPSAEGARAAGPPMAGR
jgi:CheY-like chemotaxis protein